MIMTTLTANYVDKLIALINDDSKLSPNLKSTKNSLILHIEEMNYWIDDFDKIEWNTFSDEDI